MNKALNKYKIIIFDIGGTLMEYVSMPLSWIGYYKQGFENINCKYNLNLSDKSISDSVEIMKSLNPRINYRENEIEPCIIFHKSTQHWGCNLAIENIIDAFFEGLNLKTRIFDYTLPMLSSLKKEGYILALLTDLPSGLPDEFFKRGIVPIIENCDLYVSSQSCGFRKPNSYAVNMISAKYGVSVDEILLVGDEEKDRITAQNAGCDFIWINDFIREYY